jgi:Domain of unknown function (DUF4416)
MGIPREPKPVKYFAGLLGGDEKLLVGVEVELRALLGPIDCRSEIAPWTVSRFYEKEMGAGLLRRFVAFEPLRSPEEIAAIKVATQAIEKKYADMAFRPPPRRINVDPGYIEAGKLVLASTKNASQRIYLQHGIYAEATLLYYDGRFHGLPYTYADYLWPDTQAFFSSVRALYLAQLRMVGESVKASGV